MNSPIQRSMNSPIPQRRRLICASSERQRGVCAKIRGRIASPYASRAISSVYHEDLSKGVSLMRLGAIPENILEKILMQLGLLPAPLLDTQVAYTLARTIMLGVHADVFEALALEALTAEEVSKRCETHPAATKKLLNALVGARYLRSNGETYTLTTVARKWLVRSSPQSLRDKLLMQFREWDFVAYYEEFLRTGKPLNIHQSLSEKDWEVYQRGMRSLAGVSAPEVARRTPVPHGARDMLDIGEAHTATTRWHSVAATRLFVRSFSIFPRL